MEHFDKLPEEKRQRVLGAGFTCFGRDGYKKTAMSEIAAQAGVSKASLFHYFGSKQDFYLYLLRFACDKILAEMPTGSDDLFACVDLGVQAKLRVMARYAGMYDFLFTVVKESGMPEVEQLQASVFQEASQGAARLFAHVDWSRLKPDIDPMTALTLLRWVSDGHIRSYPQTATMEEIVAGNRRYMGLLKRALYKEEYL